MRPCLSPLLILCIASPLLALDIGAIEQAAGAKGTWIEAEKVYKLTWPREDVKVTVDGQVLPPALGLTSWASLMGGKEKKAMMMGEIVCFADEVNPAVTAAIDGGLDVTALSNHFFADEPRVFFLHIEGEGTEAQLAGGVRKMLDTIQAIRAKTPDPSKAPRPPSPDPANNTITARALDAIFNATGTSQAGIYRIEFPRMVTMPCACKAGAAMGVATTATLAGTDDHAIVEGDFACVYGELQPTLKALRAGNIEIVSIHNHMDGEAPRMIFIHYRGQGKATDLATAIAATLRAQPQNRPHVHEHAE